MSQRSLVGHSTRVVLTDDHEVCDQQLRAALGENARLREALDLADWYIRCLEDVQDRRPVRGLGEAKAGWTNARHAIAQDDEHEPTS